MKRVSFTTEFLFRASPTIIHKFLTTPDCIIRWFCDECDLNEEVYSFVWDGNEETAEVIDDIEAERVRLKWEDAEDNEYLEFKMSRSEVTGETIVEITLFCDEGEEEEEIQFWETQMQALKRATGG